MVPSLTLQLVSVSLGVPFDVEGGHTSGCGSLYRQQHILQRMMKEDDVAQVVSVLLKNNVSIKPGRKHSQFPKIKSNPLSELDYDSMFQWIERKKNEPIKLKIATGEGDLSESESDSDSTDNEE